LAAWRHPIGGKVSGYNPYLLPTGSARWAQGTTAFIPGQSEPAPMTAPVGRSVHRMGWMIRLFFIHLFTLREPTFYHSQSFLAAHL